jgi:hypothetical protein
MYISPVLCWESGMPLIKLFLAGNNSRISGFPGVFRSQGRRIPVNEEKTLLKERTVFPAWKCFISKIPGFPVGN